MPQMMPMLWLSTLMIMTFLMFITMITIYFFFTPSLLYAPLSKKSKKYSYWSWKW